VGGGGEGREGERRGRAGELQGQVGGDDDFASLSLKVSCGADPEGGLRAQLNEMNAVVAVLQAGGGMADAEGLHVGDVVLTLNGASLGGERLAKAIKALPQSPTYELTVARQRNLGVILNEDGLPRGDFSGRAHRGNAWTGLRLGSSPECSCPTSFARLAGGCSWAELGSASWSATARPPASAARARTKCWCVIIACSIAVRLAMLCYATQAEAAAANAQKAKQRAAGPGRISIDVV